MFHSKTLTCQQVRSSTRRVNLLNTRAKPLSDRSKMNQYQSTYRKKKQKNVILFAIYYHTEGGKRILNSHASRLGEDDMLSRIKILLHDCLQLLAAKFIDLTQTRLIAFRYVLHIQPCLSVAVVGKTLAPQTHGRQILLDLPSILLGRNRSVLILQPSAKNECNDKELALAPGIQETQSLYIIKYHNIQLQIIDESAMLHQHTAQMLRSFLLLLFIQLQRQQ